jgi:hypothetical protein
MVGHTIASSRPLDLEYRWCNLWNPNSRHLVWNLYGHSKQRRWQRYRNNHDSSE